VQNLEPKILVLMNESSFRKNAEQVARQMQREDFREDICQTIVGE